MEIRCWGARGSLPAAGAEFSRYGGNTTCLEIRSSMGDIIVVDAGTGIRKLGHKLLREGATEINMLFTHAHWDHIMGFPFFLPLYRKATRVRVCGCSCAQENVTNLIARTMEQPFFPINYDQLTATVGFDGECPIRFSIGPIEIESIVLNHPQNGLGYRFTESGRSFVFLTDNELGFAHPGGRPPEDYVRFSRDADLLIHDAEYRESEYGLTRSWGHSVYSHALKLAHEAGARRFGMFHHNMDRTDQDMDAMVADCRKEAAAMGASMECFAVTEESVFRL